MKVLEVVLLFLTSATSDPVVRTWTFPELVFATGNNSRKLTARELNYLEDAKYAMADTYAKHKRNSSFITVLSPSGKPTWTVQELERQNPKPLEYFDNLDMIKTSEEARDFAKEHAISIAYHVPYFRDEDNKGGIEVSEPGLDISMWNIDDLKKGIKNPKTHPELKSYLEDAYMTLIDYVREGFRNESIVILTPIGLIPHKQHLVYKRKTTRRKVYQTTRRNNIRTVHPKGWPVRRWRS